MRGKFSLEQYNNLPPNSTCIPFPNQLDAGSLQRGGAHPLQGLHEVRSHVGCSTLMHEMGQRTIKILGTVRLSKEAQVSGGDGGGRGGPILPLLSINPSIIYSPIYPPIYASIHPPTHPSIHLSFCLLSLRYTRNTSLASSLILFKIAIVMAPSTLSGSSPLSFPLLFSFTLLSV